MNRSLNTSARLLSCVLIGLLSVLLLALLPSAFGASAARFTGMLSPKLRQFLQAHPPALAELTNSFDAAFTNRTIQIYYFYETDESMARAYHYYPKDLSVVIVLRENQEPSDELITLLFELINSR